MKNLLYLLISAMLAVLPAVAQSAPAPDVAAQSSPASGDISLSEFRQSLIDYSTSLATVQGQNMAQRLQAIPDATLLQWYQGVPDGRAFQSAVASFRTKKMAARSGRGSFPVTRPSVSAAISPIRRTSGQALASSSNLSGSIGTITAPIFALSPPEYPSGGHWSDMVGALQGISALQSGYPDSSQARCDADHDATLSVMVSTFRGVEEVATSICNAIPDPVVIILGEGTSIPAKEICFGINVVLSLLSSTSEALWQECEAQSNLVNGAEAYATYQNTISLSNLEFRLMAEENLMNTASPMAMFELPQLNGGYLEYCRAIVGDTITKMAALGYNQLAANAALLQGDTYYGQGSYKLAFKSYQKAYIATAN